MKKVNKQKEPTIRELVKQNETLLKELALLATNIDKIEKLFKEIKEKNK
jgi:hypothetical protein